MRTGSVWSGEADGEPFHLIIVRVDGGWLEAVGVRPGISAARIEGGVEAAGPDSAQLLVELEEVEMVAGTASTLAPRRRLYLDLMADAAGSAEAGGAGGALGHDLAARSCLLDVSSRGGEVRLRFLPSAIGLGAPQPTLRPSLRPQHQHQPHPLPPNPAGCVPPRAAASGAEDATAKEAAGALDWRERENVGQGSATAAQGFAPAGHSDGRAGHRSRHIWMAETPQLESPDDSQGVAATQPQRSFGAASGGSSPRAAGSSARSGAARDDATPPEVQGGSRSRDAPEEDEIEDDESPEAAAQFAGQAHMAHIGSSQSSPAQPPPAHGQAWMCIPETQNV